MKFHSAIIAIVLSHLGKVAAEASVEELAYPQIIDSKNIACTNNNVEGSCAAAAPIDEIEFVNINQNDTDNEEEYESDEYSQYDSDADDEYSEYESDNEHSNYNSDEDSYHDRELHEINREVMEEREFDDFDETSEYSSDGNSQKSRYISDEDDKSQNSRHNTDEEDSVYSSAESSVYSGSEWEESDFEGEPSTPAQFWQHYKCTERFKHERPIHTIDDWEKAMNEYNNVMGEDILNKEIESFKVKVETRQAGKKGRGIFAMEPIEKGTLMWSTFRTARFQSGDAYNKFLQNLDEDFACDVLQWAYVQSINSNEKQNDNADELRISVDLDEGSFCNDGRSKHRSNMQSKARNYEEGLHLNYFATRDIEQGEEILCYYDEFAVVDGWSEFYD